VLWACKIRQQSKGISRKHWHRLVATEWWGSVRFETLVSQTLGRGLGEKACGNAFDRRNLLASWSV